MLYIEVDGCGAILIHRVRVRVRVRLRVRVGVRVIMRSHAGLLIRH